YALKGACTVWEGADEEGPAMVPRQPPTSFGGEGLVLLVFQDPAPYPTQTGKHARHVKRPDRLRRRADPQSGEASPPGKVHQRCGLGTLLVVGALVCRHASRSLSCGAAAVHQSGLEWQTSQWQPLP